MLDLSEIKAFADDKLNDAENFNDDFFLRQGRN